MPKIVLALLATLALVACGGKSPAPAPATQAAAPTPTSTPSSSPSPFAPNYHVNINPADFSPNVTNPYMPLKPGTSLVYKGDKGGVPLAATYTITNQTKTIIGVKCTVVLDKVTLNGSLEEKTYDWFAQDKAGNVWYFGEDSKDYKNGVVVSTTGTWTSGVDGGQPGIVMQANTKPGKPYIEEYLPGVAEDTAQIVKDNASKKVTSGTYTNVIITHNTNPLDPSLTEQKYYAPGVGLIYENKFVSGVQEVMQLARAS